MGLVCMKCLVALMEHEFEFLQMVFETVSKKKAQFGTTPQNQ